MRREQIIRGDTWVRAWIFKDSSGPKSLAGASVRMHVRDMADALVVSMDTTNYLSVDAAAGRVDLRWDVPQNLAPANYKYDLEVTWPGGRVTTYDMTKLEVIPDVTYG